MRGKIALFATFLLVPLARSQYEYEEPLLYDTFPDGFMWGAATSAFQIEGGWDEGGKSPSIWDVWAGHTGEPGHIAEGADAKVACDSYHKYMDDVALIKGMGLTNYRLSIAWTRIIPGGTGAENPEGISYYKNLITALKDEGIEPLVTLYHWDLPQVLQDQGGWLNSESVSWFEEYARVCFREFGDQVKMWATFNEPWIVSMSGYGEGYFPPGAANNQSIGTDVYTVTHNLIKSHARAYRMYHEEFAATQNGMVGIALNYGWNEPRDPLDPADVEASERDMQFGVGWFAHPIFKDGTYPPVMREKVDLNSELQGFAESRLPTFTADESAEISGAYDFLGMNVYSTDLTYPGPGDVTSVSWYADKDTSVTDDANWYTSGSSWLQVTPFAIRKVVNWLRKEYGQDVPIVITENGVSDRIGNLDDMQRVYFLKHYINQLLKAIKIDGVNVIGYFPWSIMDNFEWNEGYSAKFGMHYIDFENDPDRVRVPKESSKFYAQIVADNGFVEGCC